LAILDVALLRLWLQKRCGLGPEPQATLSERSVFEDFR
jgi:hypothetical protein